MIGPLIGMSFFVGLDIGGSGSKFIVQEEGLLVDHRLFIYFGLRGVVLYGLDGVFRVRYGRM